MLLDNSEHDGSSKLQEPSQECVRNYIKTCTGDVWGGKGMKTGITDSAVENLPADREAQS